MHMVHFVAVSTNCNKCKHKVLKCSQQSKETSKRARHVQVDASSAQLAHDQAAIDYCFKPALDYKAAGMSASQAVLRVLTTLKEVADNAQVTSVLGTSQRLLPFSVYCQHSFLLFSI